MSFLLVLFTQFILDIKYYCQLK